MIYERMSSVSMQIATYWVYAHNITASASTKRNPSSTQEQRNIDRCVDGSRQSRVGKTVGRRSITGMQGAERSRDGASQERKRNGVAPQKSKGAGGKTKYKSPGETMSFRGYSSGLVLPA